MFDSARSPWCYQIGEEDYGDGEEGLKERNSETSVNLNKSTAHNMRWDGIICYQFSRQSCDTPFYRRLLLQIDEPRSYRHCAYYHTSPNFRRKLTTKNNDSTKLQQLEQKRLSIKIRRGSFNSDNITTAHGTNINDAVSSQSMFLVGNNTIDTSADTDVDVIDISDPHIASIGQDVEYKIGSADNCSSCSLTQSITRNNISFSTELTLPTTPTTKGDSTAITTVTTPPTIHRVRSVSDCTSTKSTSHDLNLSSSTHHMPQSVESYNISSNRDVEVIDNSRSSAVTTSVGVGVDSIDYEEDISKTASSPSSSNRRRKTIGASSSNVGINIIDPLSIDNSTYGSSLGNRHRTNTFNSATTVGSISRRPFGNSLGGGGIGNSNILKGNSSNNWLKSSSPSLGYDDDEDEIKASVHIGTSRFRNSGIRTSSNTFEVGLVRDNKRLLWMQAFPNANYTYGSHHVLYSSISTSMMANGVSSNLTLNLPFGTIGGGSSNNNTSIYGSGSNHISSSGHSFGVGSNSCATSGTMLNDEKVVFFAAEVYRVTLESRVCGEVVLTSRFLYFHPTPAVSKVNSTPISSVSCESTAVMSDERWQLDGLQNVFGRRQYYKNCGIELYFINCSELFLAFESSAELQTFYSRLGKQYTPLLPSSLPPTTLNPRQVFAKLPFTEQWRKRQMSNYEYIMRLNLAAGRSFNDISQYPVFPWVLADYTSPQLNLFSPSTYRDLSKPIGALDAKRLQGLLERYNNFDSDSPSEIPFLYGG